MEMISLEIEDVKLVKPRVFPDDRGFFMQTYHEKQYREAGITARFVQDNWSRSTQGVLRGLHYQLKNPQDKLVSVIRGEVFDVAVDIRRGSPTFGKWVGAILSEENRHQLFVPKGFAHGFCVLSDEVDFVYKCSDFYTPGDEYGVRWDDPDIGIEWLGAGFLVSEKDQKVSFLKDIPEKRLPSFKKQAMPPYSV
jgi:dTDP-4-dehydrorhamnose 3,5-epimerase